MNPMIQKLRGANLDVDMATPQEKIAWKQDQCPWNADEHTAEHRCAVKDISICPYFCGIEYLDTLLCCYPHPNPLKNLRSKVDVTNRTKEKLERKSDGNNEFSKSN